MKKTKLKKDWYSAAELCRMPDFPYASYSKAKELIDKGIIKAKSLGSGKGKRYYVHRKELNRFIRSYHHGAINE